MSKIVQGRHCLPSNEPQVAPVPGLSEVLSSCELLTKSAMTSVSVSIPSSERDSELIALSQEAAEQSGICMDIESSGGTLVLRFSRESRR